MAHLAIDDVPPVSTTSSQSICWMVADARSRALPTASSLLTVDEPTSLLVVHAIVHGVPIRSEWSESDGPDLATSRSALSILARFPEPLRHYSCLVANLKAALLVLFCVAILPFWRLPDQTWYQLDDETSQAPIDVEKVCYSQPGLLDSALAKIRPERPGKVDLYFVGFGSFGAQNVRQRIAVRERAEHEAPSDPQL